RLHGGRDHVARVRRVAVSAVEPVEVKRAIAILKVTSSFLVASRSGRIVSVGSFGAHKERSEARGCVGHYEPVGAALSEHGTRMVPPVVLCPPLVALTLAELEEVCRASGRVVLHRENWNARVCAYCGELLAVRAWRSGGISASGRWASPA